MEPLLQVKNLRVHFFTKEGIIPAINGVDFHINKAETVALVGESGCGKSITALSIMRLVGPPGKIVTGEILFKEQDISKKPEKELRKLRGNEMSMIFQEPMSSLNPVYSVGDQISEAIRLHQGLRNKEAVKKTIEMLSLVGISAPERRIKQYPHELSGGMRQRIMIAMALSCNPKLLIADEPTTALDVTIQAQILSIIKDLKDKLHTSILLITHDLGIVAQVAQRVVVMYGGKVVEEAPVSRLFLEPKHPYTAQLLKSIPSINKRKERLYVIEGMVPHPLEMPNGCSFHPRCHVSKSICQIEEPSLVVFDDEIKVRCWKYFDLKEECIGSDKFKIS